MALICLLTVTMAASCYKTTYVSYSTDDGGTEETKECVRSCQALATKSKTDDCIRQCPGLIRSENTCRSLSASVCANVEEEEVDWTPYVVLGVIVVGLIGGLVYIAHGFSKSKIH